MNTADRPRGRPRSFDRDQAIDTALALFWQRGYGAVSVPDLVAAMGIHAPSFYAAFGSKEQLLLEVVARYEARQIARIEAALDPGLGVRKGIAALLDGIARRFSDTDSPFGCFFIASAESCSASSPATQAILAAKRSRVGALLQRRLEQAVAAGELPPGFDSAGTAAFLQAVIQGMSVQARDGAPHATLQAIADTALQALPPTGQ